MVRFRDKGDRPRRVRADGPGGTGSSGDPRRLRGSRASRGPLDQRDQRDSGEDCDYVVWGRRPVVEAVESGRQVNKILVVKGGSDPEVLALAREHRVPVSFVDRATMDRAAAEAGAGNHQGVLAFLAPISYVQIDDILEAARAAGQDPFIAVLDGIEDPQNLGSIIRTANAARAHGVVIPARRSSQVSPAVVRASAGAAAHTPVARVVNIANCIERLKQAGVWVVGTEPEAPLPLWDADLTGPIAVVVGSEGRSMSRLVGERCDFTVNIPMGGKLASLNAGVAWAVVAFEIVRQRLKKGGPVGQADSDS